MPKKPQPEIEPGWIHEDGEIATMSAGHTSRWSEITDAATLRKLSMVKAHRTTELSRTGPHSPSDVLATEADTATPPGRCWLWYEDASDDYDLGIPQATFDSFEVAADEIGIKEWTRYGEDYNWLRPADLRPSFLVTVAYWYDPNAWTGTSSGYTVAQLEQQQRGPHWVTRVLRIHEGEAPNDHLLIQVAAR